jgi:oligoendopeptidase F
MFSSLPKTAQEFMQWSWAQIEPYYQDLTKRPLTAENVNSWLADWSHLSELIDEEANRLSVATTLNTSDQDAKKRYFDFLDNIFTPAQTAEQALKQQLLASGLQPAGFEIPLRNMRAEAELFREENLLLLTDERKLGTEYDELIGAQTVMWEGQEVTPTHLLTVSQNPDRSVREKAWRLILERKLKDRAAQNTMWAKFLELRMKISKNAGFSDYRSYRWKLTQRFDYTPEDCASFERAIEEVVVPAATRLYQRQGQALGVDTLRPWDLGRDNIYPVSRHPLHPYQEIEELETKALTMFKNVDPQLGEYFQTMRSENLLDLPNRKNKAPGAYCTGYAVQKRPFVFMNAIGLHDDVQTLLHESGHAFHVFESNHLPYIQQTQIGMEIAEVASMSMELLAAPYLAADKGGFYTEKDAALALSEHLESLLVFWPFMSVVDSFQHWVYENPAKAVDPENCDEKWSELWDRFIPGVDWSGLDNEKETGWHRKLHIFQAPFYYIEYGLAQLGAVQVWRNSLKDQAGAVKNYRQALSLGATKTLPELFATAGAKFAFDVDTVKMAVDLIEQKLDELQPA